MPQKISYPRIVDALNELKAALRDVDEDTRSVLRVVIRKELENL